MTTETVERSLQYPIGFPKKASSFTAEERLAAVDAIRQLPDELRNAAASLSEQQLATPYRLGGWTVRQLVHHVADSHMNAYIRIRLALTEDWPTIVPYQEALWANLEDATTAPVALSLDLLQSLHGRWVQLFTSIDGQAWKRGYTHPENGRQSVEQAAILYAWHGRHHTAHVTGLSARMGW